MKHKIFRAMAYIFMPFIFTILGYFIIYLATEPVLSMLQVTLRMVLAKEMPEFDQELKSIYNPIGNQEVMVLQQGKITESTDKEPQNVNSGEIIPVENVVSIKDIQFPDLGTHFANLSCERIGLNAPVYWGDTDEVLKVGVGQFMGSFLPGFNRSILLSGHNTTYFKPLRIIEAGDVITYHTNYGIFEYKVTEVNVISSSDAENRLNDMLSFEEEKLFMYTCYPFETLVGTKRDRLFVFAVKISGPIVE